MMMWAETECYKPEPDARRGEQGFPSRISEEHGSADIRISDFILQNYGIVYIWYR